MPRAEADLDWSPARYDIPAHIFSRLDEMSWETLIEMSSGFCIRAGERKPELMRLQKQLSMARMLLVERAREQGDLGRVDPKLLVDLVRLLERCERMSAHYRMDLEEFNQFVYLMILKVKKHRLARHEGRAGAPVGQAISHYSPIDEDEWERLKKRSEKKGRR